MTDKKQITCTIGSDHAGYALKEHLKSFGESQGWHFSDMGCHSELPYDYPLIAQATAREVIQKKAQRGVLICGSGIGMSITANRYPGVYAALVHTADVARLAKEHNNANILVLASRTTLPKTAEEILSAWLSSSFADGRHGNRLELIDKLQKNS